MRASQAAVEDLLTAVYSMQSVPQWHHSKGHICTEHLTFTVLSKSYMTDTPSSGGSALLTASHSATNLDLTICMSRRPTACPLELQRE